MFYRRKVRSSIVYWHKDKLYLNITNRCSNRCYFCFRNFTNGVWGFNLKLRHEPTEMEVIKELEKYINRRFWSEVSFCGFGEPTERLDCILKISMWIYRNHKIPVRLETNGHGYLLNPTRDVVKELKKAHVDKVSVSLNAADPETYDRICKPVFRDAFNSVLEFIRMAKDEMEVEVTTVSVPEVNIEDVEKLAERLGVNFRMRVYEYPIM